MKDDKEPVREEVGKTQSWTRVKANVSGLRSRKERVGDRRSEEAGCVPRAMERHRRILRGRVTRSVFKHVTMAAGMGKGWKGPGVEADGQGNEVMISFPLND